jgi:hypothetical protein
LNTNSIDSGSNPQVPKLSYLVRDDLLQLVLGFFSQRTGVSVWFQDASGYTIAPEQEVPVYCQTLLNHDRCGLTNPNVEMAATVPDMPQFRSCIGGIGHLIIPILATSTTGAVTELGRVITEPLAIRPTGPENAHPSRHACRRGRQDQDGRPRRAETAGRNRADGGK